MPDERMIVWASGKDRRVVDAPLHTNFTIPAAGGTLQLLAAAATDAVLSQFDLYPAQMADVSYGRDEWDPATAAPATLVGIYSVPSPAERNNYIGPGVVRKGADRHSEPGVLRHAVSRSRSRFPRSRLNPAAEIRYTLTGGAATDRPTPIGPVPTPTSTLYTGPIRSVRLRSCAPASSHPVFCPARPKPQLISCSTTPPRISVRPCRSLR